MTMQQEALQRVRQMQQRAMLAVEGAPPSPPPITPRFMPPLFASQPPFGHPQQGETNPFAGQEQTNTGQTNTGQASAGAPLGGQPPPLGGARPRQGQGNGQGASILSQLFGGGQRSNGQSGGNRQGGTSASPSGSNGILDFIRSKLSATEGGSGLGDSLKSSIGSVSQPLSDLLDAFSIDGEKLVILLVMWVIFNERSDNKMLLLALGYLLL